MKKILEPDFEIHIQYFVEENFFFLEDQEGYVVTGASLDELFHNYGFTLEVEENV